MTAIGDPRKPGLVGRPRKPPERKINRNDPNYKPVDLSMLSDVTPGAIPDPPRKLGPIGREMWNDVWGAAASWISPHADIRQVWILCEQLDERETLRAEVLQYGDRYQRAALRAIEGQIIAGLGLIGFNPVERARLNVVTKKPPTLLEEIAEKRRQKAG